MEKDDHVSPHHAQDVNSIRQFYLLQDALAFLERAAGLGGGGCDKSPCHQSDGQVRQVDSDVCFEEPRVDYAEQHDEYAHTQRDPERPQKRTPVALAYVIPSEHPPNLAA